MAYPDPYTPIGGAWPMPPTPPNYYRSFGMPSDGTAPGMLPGGQVPVQPLPPGAVGTPIGPGELTDVNPPYGPGPAGVGPAGLVNPPQRPQDRTLGEYRTPAQNVAALRARGRTQDQIHQAAVNFANQRMGTLRTVMSVVNDPTLGAILASRDDPLTKYTAASRRWSELAKADGYNDPRAWLQDKVKRWRTG